MKVIIAGGRDFNDYDLLDKEVSSILNSMMDTPMDNFIIVSGRAKGADKLGEQYALYNDFDLKVFKANWRKFGIAAGPIRNKSMAEYGDVLIAFWDGKSKGTKNMIDVADKLKLKTFVIKYERQ